MSKPNEACHFCGGPDGCYQKRDDRGSYHDCCFSCARKGNPVPVQFQAQARKVTTKGELPSAQIALEM